MSDTVVYDETWTPKVTLTRGDDYFEAVVEVTELDPQRYLSADERFAGIRDLDPPTVRVPILRRRRDSHRRLIDSAQRAVTAATTSTLGSTGGPAALLFTHFRVALGIRGALRMLDEDI